MQKMMNFNLNRFTCPMLLTDKHSLNIPLAICCYKICSEISLLDTMPFNSKAACYSVLLNSLIKRLFVYTIIPFSIWTVFQRQGQCSSNLYIFSAARLMSCRTYVTQYIFHHWPCPSYIHSIQQVFSSGMWVSGIVEKSMFPCCKYSYHL